MERPIKNKTNKNTKKTKLDESLHQTAQKKVKKCLNKILSKQSDASGQWALIHNSDLTSNSYDNTTHESEM